MKYTRSTNPEIVLLQPDVTQKKLCYTYVDRSSWIHNVNVSANENPATESHVGELGGRVSQ